MLVVKRNGKKEEFKIEKLRKVIQFACEGENYQSNSLEEDIVNQIFEGISTAQIQKMLIQIAVEKTTVNSPKWQYIAAKLLAYNLYKESGINRNYENIGYGSFEKLVKELVCKNIYGEYILENYNEDDIRELGSYIKSERDLLFNYVGLKLLADRYMAKDFQGRTMELPQERFMIIAMHLAMKEKNKLKWAKEFYDVLSKLEVTVATPTLNNAGKPFYQLSSCFIDTVDDNLWSIYNSDNAFAQISKHGGGMGLYVGKIRAQGSTIRGHEGKSRGVIPWIKNYNNTAVAVDQLGVRKGAVAVYLDVWHGDILDFLNLKTNNGDDRLKAHDIFTGVCIPDIFMEKVKNRESFYLFDPMEIRKNMGYNLEDFFDDYDKKEFTKRYLECANNPQISKKEIPAIDIMKKIMASAFETGAPFIFFRDKVNRDNPNKHSGMIYSSNLCTEIMQNMSPAEFISEELEDGVIVTKVKPGDFVVCNLSSVNLGKINSEEDLKRIIPVQVRMLDNVIDLNFYPIKQSEFTNKKYRAVGLGVSGYHHYLVNKGIHWESDEHMEESNNLFEQIAYFSIKASMELSKERGKYSKFENSCWHTGEYFDVRGYNSERWLSLKNDVKEYGLRNGWIMAVAPTSSTALIAGTTAGIDPVYRKFFIEEKKGSVIPQTAPDLSSKNLGIYKEAHLIDQKYSIKAAGIRQRHIDQGQSFNLYIKPNEITAKEFLQLYIDAYENNLKSIYYVRSQSLEVEECSSCTS